MSSKVSPQASSGGPSPTPSRANYGFALYLGARGCLVVYLCWGLLGGGGVGGGGGLLVYLPQPYWAVALPLHLLTTLALFAFLFYPALNLRMTPGPEDPRVLGDPRPPSPPPGTAPQPYDLPPSLVSRTLYAL